MNSKMPNLNSQIYKFDPITSVVLKNAIIEIAKELIPNFILTDELSKMYNNLFMYFTGNEYSLDLNKGIYLHGIYGIGKSMTMKVFNIFLQRHFNYVFKDDQLIPNPNNYGITSIEELAEYYKREGNLLKFGRNFDEGKLIAHNKCINEFGKPLDEKHYGTSIQNVINSTLMIRYELFQERKAITHVTSNYHPRDLKCFDDALLDRFKEMFNFIELKGDSFRI